MMIKRPVSLGVALVVFGPVLGVAGGALGGGWFYWGALINVVTSVVGFGLVFTWLAQRWGNKDR